MPELPIQFNPSRLLQFRKRLLPVQEREETLTAAIGEEEPTPRAALFFLILFIFFSNAQLAAWLPGHSDFRGTIPLSGPAYLIDLMRLSLTPALLSLICIIVYRAVRGETVLVFRPQIFLYAAFFTCAIISVPFSYHPTRSLNFAFSDILKLLFLVLITVNVVRNIRSVKTLMWALALTGCIPAIGALLANYDPERFAFYVTPDGRTGWTGFFLNPNTIGTTMCLLIPVALCLISLSKSLAAKVFAGGLICLYGFTLLKMLSRGALLSLSVIVLLYVITSKNKLRNLALTVVLGITAFAAVPAARERAATVATFQEDPSAMSRIQLWKAGINMALRNPLWGIGASCFPIASADYFREGAGFLRWRDPHNSYIAVVAEMGFLGLLVFAGIMFLCLRDGWLVHKKFSQSSDPEARKLAHAGKTLTLAFAALLLVGLTGTTTYLWMLHMFAALLISLKIMSQRFAPEI